MASTLQDGDENAPLEFLEFEALPPMSPSMQRALCEAFSDDPEVQEEQEAVSYPQPSDSNLKELSLQAESPSLETMATTAEWQDVGTMSPIDKSSTAISSRDSAEAKRAKRSAIEKRSRQRRQNVLGRMREEVKQLEKVYAELTKKNDDATRQEGGGALLDSTALSVGTLGHKYSQLSLIVQALEEDRARMLKLLEAHDVFQRTAEAMAKRGDGRHQALEDLNQSEVVCDTDLPRSSSFGVTIPKRSPAECYELVRETYEMIQHFDDGGHFVSTGANFMGWTDKRKHDRSGSLVYGFAKNFPLESAEGLLMRTWDVFCHADSMAHLSFDASVATRFQIVQRLGDDLCIIRRDHKFAHMPMNFLTLSIVFRIQTPKGFTLCMRTIPSPHLQDALEPHEHVYDVFHWTHFNNLFDDDGHTAGCEITTGGYVGDVEQKLISKYWLFELVVSVLRWESMCVAPLFLKCV
ncbi:hypothetical protein PHYBOEH_001390 [Phytophthora boehmeriae]|uniref:BZIP domain-containing protein n=1 Tax=Phytophthora boehmeriae TaxID=109152 RepID=A0A8T1XAR1_9STRA|nr:hypothetical protein PHYBOEH_001390 [Phytophthora boehmeriae]